MEGDWPSRNTDRKLPILDMKVWTREDGTLLYQHYEKSVSSKTVIDRNSGHPESCKRSVHTQEIIRRLLNCSHRLDWQEDVTPYINEYMRRMKRAGYGEKYRKGVLAAALGIVNRKWQDHNNGIRPIFRPKDWNKEERKERKQRNKTDWATKGGHIAPIFVPATPRGELAKEMKKVADVEARDGIHFKIVEMGGRTIKSELQRSNPTATPGCNKDDCLACKTGGRGKGGQCHRNNVNYKISCGLCPEGRRAVYIGETSRNLYTRAKQHKGNKDEESSFMRKHMEDCHRGEEEDFRAEVTNTNKDCLTRLVREGVLIRRCQDPLLNTRSEWHQPSLYRVQAEVVRE